MLFFSRTVAVISSQSCFCFSSFFSSRWALSVSLFARVSLFLICSSLSANNTSWTSRCFFRASNAESFFLHSLCYLRAVSSSLRKAWALCAVSAANAASLNKFRMRMALLIAVSAASCSRVSLTKTRLGGASAGGLSGRGLMTNRRRRHVSPLHFACDLTTARRIAMLRPYSSCSPILLTRFTARSEAFWPRRAALARFCNKKFSPSASTP